jgi:DNA helicase-2/ATP-dependent DNA helicase PcrA
VAYARCPLQYYWSAVRPLPRPPSPAARIGTQVHAWIEQRCGPRAGVVDPEDAEPADPGEPGSLTTPARLRDSFLDSPYASLGPLGVEAPFELVVDGHLVRGRVDAVYERDGHTELVDFKTGRRPPPDDGGAGVQLDLYALAAVEAWNAAPRRIRTTNCYLRADGGPELDTRPCDEERIEAARQALAAWLAQIGDRRFPARPGAWCHRCDFLPFCEPGQSFTASA